MVRCSQRCSQLSVFVQDGAARAAYAPAVRRKRRSAANEVVPRHAAVAVAKPRRRRLAGREVSEIHCGRARRTNAEPQARGNEQLHGEIKFLTCGRIGNASPNDWFRRILILLIRRRIIRCATSRASADANGSVFRNMPEHRDPTIMRGADVHGARHVRRVDGAPKCRSRHVRTKLRVPCCLRVHWRYLKDQGLEL